MIDRGRHNVLGVMVNAVDTCPLGTDLMRGAAEIHQQRHERSIAFFTENAHRFADRQALISEADVYVPTIVDVIEHARARPFRGRKPSVGPRPIRGRAKSGRRRG